MVTADPSQARTLECSAGCVYGKEWMGKDASDITTDSAILCLVGFTSPISKSDFSYLAEGRKMV